MTEKNIVNKLHQENILTDQESQKIHYYYKHKLFSLHWEIKTILYLGVLLLSTGVGLAIYENIDSISHQAILAAIGLACFGCFFYCFRKLTPYSHEFVESPGLLFDYIGLLGCLLFLSFEGYFQYKYEIFGTRYGMAVMIPALLFSFIAYRFDHKGILSLAITGIAGWMGLAVTPHELLLGTYEFPELTMIWTGLGFGITIGFIAFALEKKGIKKHFTPTYLNFSSNTLFIASLSGLIIEEGWLKVFFMFLLFSFCTVFFIHAKRTHSYYYLILSVIYGYIGITYLIFLGLSQTDEEWLMIYTGIFYFIFSCAGIIWFFVNIKKIFKS
jgi:hypothetical protein